MNKLQAMKEQFRMHRAVREAHHGMGEGMWSRHRMGHRHDHHGMGRGRFFEPGESRLALLALIAEKPRHGYDLMTELEARSGGAYRPSAGSVYPKLQQLEDEGLATVKKEGGKNVFEATEAGKELVRAEQATIDEIWERASELADWGPASHPAAMEIARHVRGFAKEAFKAVTRRGVDPDRVREITDRARNDLKRLKTDGR